MGVTTKILQALKNSAEKGEMTLWHGTRVHPNELAKGAKSLVEPKFSSEFFKKGTGGMVQGPGLYASEEKGVGKHYADIVSSYDSAKIVPTVRGESVYKVLDNIGIEDKGVRQWGIEQLKQLQRSSENIGSLMGGPDYTFGNDKREILNNIKGMKKVADKYSDTRIDLDDLLKVEAFIAGLKKKDFSVEKERYLYRVAFPKERYLDWYEHTPESVDLLNFAAKETGVPAGLTRVGGYVFPDRAAPVQRSTGRDTLNKIEDMLRHSMYEEEKKKGNLTFDVPSKVVSDLLEKAGFAGTKYRGDQQRGNYFNYVLMKPERARILDAFKFGVPLTVAGSQIE